MIARQTARRRKREAFLRPRDTACCSAEEVAFLLLNSWC
jgi:hypothetical protein